MWVMLGGGWNKLFPKAAVACVRVAQGLRMAFKFPKGCKNSQIKAAMWQRPLAPEPQQTPQSLFPERPAGLQVCKVNWPQTESQQKRHTCLLNVSFTWLGGGEGWLHKEEKHFSWV